MSWRWLPLGLASKIAYHQSMVPLCGGRPERSLRRWGALLILLVPLQACGRIWYEELDLPTDASPDGIIPTDGQPPIDATSDAPTADAPVSDSGDAAQDVIQPPPDAGDATTPDAGSDAQPDTGTDSGVVTAASYDTYIKGLDNTPHGSDVDLQVGRAQGGNLIYLLVQFDLSAIPTNATVTSAKLRLYQYESNSSGTFSLAAHQITQAWDEASATFNNANTTTPWSGGPGGTYVATAAATTSVPIGTYGWYEWDLTALTQQWVNLSVANYGVEITMGSVNQGQWEGFASRENLTASEHPQLVVSWQ